MNKLKNISTFILFCFLGIVTLVLSCSEVKINTPEDARKKFEIFPSEYLTNHFFLDTIYASVSPSYNFYRNYYYLITLETDSSRYYNIKSLTVWKLTNDIIDAAIQKYANAYISLPPRIEGEEYDSRYTDIANDQLPGETIINKRFEMLVEGKDYTYNSSTGVVSFLNDILNSDAYAITYSIEGGRDYDLFFGDFNFGEIAVLKLIKPQYLQPNFKQAWKLQLRNIYSIGAENILEDGFELDIQINIANKYQKYIETFDEAIPLVTEFKLDRVDENGERRPDGEFDFLKGKTINKNNGEIIFPVLEPFGRDFPKNIPDSFKVFDLYDTTKLFVEKADKLFKITGKFKN